MARAKKKTRTKTAAKAPAGRGAPAKSAPRAARKAPAKKVTRPDGSSGAKARQARARDGLPIVVGIVGSAGSLTAFQKFFHGIPADSGMAFVVVPHLDPKRNSMMVPLLSRHAKMPVAEAKRNELLAPNRVYVLPPDRYLAVRQNHLRLTGPVDASGPQTSIDFFLRSLAEDCGERAVCVVLSGTGAHGSLGLKLVKAQGGMAMVQDPAEAEFDQMPANAAATGIADHTLPVERMAPVLLAYARQFGSGAPALEPRPSDVDRFVELLRTRAEVGFDFRHYRKSSLLRRVLRRMALVRVESFDQYFRLLEKDAAEVRRLMRDLLINVTTFFRDPDMFRVLETHVIRDLVARKADREELRVWVPGCATGEEAYSIVIVALEQFAAQDKAPSLQVFGTDVVPECLDAARRGIYPDSIRGAVSPVRVGRFFQAAADHELQVTRQVRDAALFAQQNLLSDIPFSRLDLVSCRNVLIYLEPEMQEKVLLKLHFALADGGHLVLGPSESIGRRTDLFKPVSRKWRIFRRVGGRRPRSEYPLGTAAVWRGSAASRYGGLAQTAQSLLLHLYGPAAVVVDGANAVLHFSGATERYLRQPAGQPTHDLVLLAPEGLRATIRATTRKALGGESCASAGTRVDRDGATVLVRVTARPLRLAGRDDALALVTFEDAGRPQKPSKRAALSANNTIIRQLRDELTSSRDELQNTVDDLERTNEDLRTSNEEVRSMNEELQSANEELESSREELQSVNEELTSANSQLQENVVELEKAHSDMANLLRSGEVAALFLDSNLVIRRFTPAVTRLFNLIEDDAGRALSDITARFDDPELRPDVEAVLQSESRAAEKDVKTEDGRHFLRRITPYHADGVDVRGVVISFSDVTALKHAEQGLRDFATKLEERVAQRTAALRHEITERKRIEAALRDESRRNATVLRTAAALIVVRDAEGRIECFNEACERASGYTLDEVRGNPVRDWLTKEDRATVSEVYRRLARESAPVTLENCWHHRDGSQRSIAWSMSGIYGAGGKLEHTVGVGIDITRERQAQKLATQRQQELLHIYRVHTAGGLAAALAHELNQPLAALVAYCETSLAALRAGNAKPEQIAGNLDNATGQAHRAAAIIRELRGFLSKSSGTLRPVDLQAVIHSVHGLIEAQLQEARVELRIEIAADLPRAVAGRIQLEQLLVNLVKNAIEAIEEAGQEDGCVAVSAAMSSNNLIQVSVADNGPGLTAEAVQRLFEPFYTTKNEGLGMGLAISRSIAEAHGGRLWAEPGEHGGAIFHFTIPIET